MMTVFHTYFDWGDNPPVNKVILQDASYSDALDLVILLRSRGYDVWMTMLAARGGK
jgi:hypothetical protein